MPKKTVTYKLSYSVKNAASSAATQGTSYPKRTRLLLARLLDSQTQANHKERASILNELGELFVETQDWPKVISYAKQELEGFNTVLPLASATLHRIKCRACARLGRACRELGSTTLAIQYTQQYYRYTLNLQDKEDEFDSLCELILCFIARGESEEGSADDYDEAKALIKRAAALLKTLNLTEERMKVLHAHLYVNFGIVQNNTHHSDEAIEKLNISRAIYRKYGERMDEARAICNLACCYERKGDLTQAIRLGKDELDIYRHLDYIEGQISALWDMGIRLEKLCRFADATNVYKKIGDLCRSMDDVAQLDRATHAIKQVKAAESKLGEVSALDPQIITAMKRQDLRSELRLRGVRGSLFVELGKDKEAISDFEGQRKIASTLAVDGDQLCKILFNLAQSYFRTSSYAEVIKYLRQILSTPNTHVDSSLKIEILGMLGRSLAESSNVSHSQVTSTFEELLALGRRGKDLNTQKLALSYLCKMHRRFDFKGKEEQCLTELELVKTAIREKQEGGVEDDFGSVDSEQLTDHENDTPNPELDEEHIDDIEEDIEANDLPIDNDTNGADFQQDSNASSILSQQKKKKQSTVSTPATSICRRRVIESTPDYSQNQYSQVSNSRRFPTTLRELGPGPSLNVIAKDPIVLSESDEDDDDDLMFPTYGRSSRAPFPKSPITDHTTKHLISESHSLENIPSIVPSSNKENNNATIVCPLNESPKRKNQVHAEIVTSTPISSLPSTPVINRGSVYKQSRLSFESNQNTPSFLSESCPVPIALPLKVRVSIPLDSSASSQTELFAIPCLPSALNGTPRTVGWLAQEARRRYAGLYHRQPKIKKLVIKDAQSGLEETLFPQDVLQHVLERNQIVHAVLTDDDE